MLKRRGSCFELRGTPHGLIEIIIFNKLQQALQSFVEI